MSDTEYLFVGGSTSGARKGISILRFDEDHGTLERLGESEGVVNPSWLSIDPDRQLIYACSESADHGALVTFHFDLQSSQLSRVGSVATHGAYPCFNLISRDRKHVLLANYGNVGADPDKAVAIFPLDPSGIPLPELTAIELAGTGPRLDRQERSHPHSVMETAIDNAFAVTDLGTDVMTLFAVSAPGNPLTVSRKVLPAGSGPRHAKLHPGGRFALVNGELDSSLMCLDHDFRLVSVQSTLPSGGWDKNSTAEVCITPDGGTVYVSNRGHDSIAIFAFDTATGALMPKGHVPSGGISPRHFTLTRSGRYLIAANQGSDNLTIFARDTVSGTLSDTGLRVPEPAPSCVRSVVFG